MGTNSSFIVHGNHHHHHHQQQLQQEHRLRSSSAGDLILNQQATSNNKPNLLKKLLHHHHNHNNSSSTAKHKKKASCHSDTSSNNDIHRSSVPSSQSSGSNNSDHNHLQTTAYAVVPAAPVKASSSSNSINKSTLTLNLNNNSNNTLTRKIMALSPKTNPIYEDYIISKQVLGLGISGKVLSCEHKQTHAKYALKTLKDTQKARREIDLQWRSCQGCPYIVQIKDVYENVVNNQKVLLIVMECMQGGELFARISERQRPFTEQEVAKMMRQICTAVRHLHRMNIAHRDLKPENLLLTTPDESALIKLTDFGFAKEVSAGLMTPCYTPYYVAPEVLGSTKYDISCDIWSLGVIMYILCCGYPPFYSTHGQPISPGMKKRIKAGEYTFPEAEWSRVSQDSKDLIRGMLETMPERRVTIEDVMRSPWIAHYDNVPQTPLHSVEILKEERDNWKDVQQNFGTALNEMRVNWDSNMKLKNISDANNPLLKKRREKATSPPGAAESSTATLGPVMAAPPPNQHQLTVIPEQQSLNRDTSMQSVAVTPTNSRPSSPSNVNVQMK